MGKNKQGGLSWLAAVKRAFRSPSKEKQEDYGEENRREKRTWLFRKPAKPETSIGSEEKTQSAMPMEVIRLRAAIYIQTIFRGYLSRRALSALKGLVRFQALIRGENLRRQIKALRYMQSLIRSQSQMLNRGVIQGIDGISLLSDEWEEKPILHDSRRQFQFSTASSKQSSKRRHQSFGNEGEISSHRWMVRAPTDQKQINPQRFSYPHSMSSPLHRLPPNQAPSTPSRTRPPPQFIRSASPRSSREEKQSPSRVTSMPNYMAPTESAKAKSRWHSAPRQRPMTPEMEHGLDARKRLTYKRGYGVKNDYDMAMRSPSFKSVCGGVEEGSSYSSCCNTYNESLVGGDIYPSLKSDLIKKWHGRGN